MTWCLLICIAIVNLNVFAFKKLYLTFMPNQVLFLMLRFILCNVVQLSACNFLCGWLDNLSVDYLGSWLPARSGGENAPTGLYVVPGVSIYRFIASTIFIFRYVILCACICTLFLLHWMSGFVGQRHPYLYWNNILHWDYNFWGVSWRTVFSGSVVLQTP